MCVSSRGIKFKNGRFAGIGKNGGRCGWCKRKREKGSVGVNVIRNGKRGFNGRRKDVKRRMMKMKGNGIMSPGNLGKA
ncbi:hypothetical protein, partial [Bacillus altitudinis]|uniref:hypothetical protein n=1 Tax=Bacillus altitudinis TaxID=293387 RepID=UPI001C92E949